MLLLTEARFPLRSPLFTAANLEAENVERFHLQSSKMLKVTMAPGRDVLAVKGSMVAFQGQVQFDHEGAGSVGKFLRKMVAGDDVPLMRVAGQGDVFFADQAKDVFLIDLEGDALSVNGSNLLAFDAAGIQWDIHRVQGAGVLASGAFNTLLQGTGTVAVTTDGTPMLLDCSTQPTYVDIDAAVAWSANLTPQIVHSMKFKSLLRGGSGEAAQLAFHGPGFVVVQPSEGLVVPPCNGGHGQQSGAAGLLNLFD